MSLVVHEQNFDIAEIVNKELPESSLDLMSGSIIVFISNVDHSHSASESSPDTRVNTSWFSPGFSNSHVSVGVVSLE
eukprot:CAMPEP_0196995728 /NCGR_PEP_ID=MMETSP1380-20130617/1794_1 /TAXON_ID=5936 /ORGANISM="Euplotes crassus, Strain CT5" /LENGTH=76 /DNA_ID=CAMNT_0042411493 /DNA_START=218 /DNA_END=448 /DNA_ORIENTATION=+